MQNVPSTPRRTATNPLSVSGSSYTQTLRSPSPYPLHAGYSYQYASPHPFFISSPSHSLLRETDSPAPFPGNITRSSFSSPSAAAFDIDLELQYPLYSQSSSISTSASTNVPILNAENALRPFSTLTAASTLLDLASSPSLPRTHKSFSFSPSSHSQSQASSQTSEKRSNAFMWSLSPHKASHYPSQKHLQSSSSTAFSGGSQNSVFSTSSSTLRDGPFSSPSSTLGFGYSAWDHSRPPSFALEASPNFMIPSSPLKRALTTSPGLESYPGTSPGRILDSLDGIGSDDYDYESEIDVVYRTHFSEDVTEHASVHATDDESDDGIHGNGSCDLASSEHRSDDSDHHEPTPVPPNWPAVVNSSPAAPAPDRTSKELNEQRSTHRAERRRALSAISKGAIAPSSVQTLARFDVPTHPNTSKPVIDAAVTRVDRASGPAAVDGKTQSRSQSQRFTVDERQEATRPSYAQQRMKLTKMSSLRHVEQVHSTQSPTHTQRNPEPQPEPRSNAADVSSRKRTALAHARDLVSGTSTVGKFTERMQRDVHLTTKAPDDADINAVTRSLDKPNNLGLRRSSSSRLTFGSSLPSLKYPSFDSNNDPKHPDDAAHALSSPFHTPSKAAGSTRINEKLTMLHEKTKTEKLAALLENVRTAAASPCPQRPGECLVPEEDDEAEPSTSTHEKVKSSGSRGRKHDLRVRSPESSPIPLFRLPLPLPQPKSTQRTSTPLDSPLSSLSSLASSPDKSPVRAKHARDTLALPPFYARCSELKDAAGRRGGSERGRATNAGVDKRTVRRKISEEKTVSPLRIRLPPASSSSSSLRASPPVQSVQSRTVKTYSQATVVLSAGSNSTLLVKKTGRSTKSESTGDLQRGLRAEAPLALDARAYARTPPRTRGQVALPENYDSRKFGRVGKDTCTDSGVPRLEHHIPASLMLKRKRPRTLVEVNDIQRKEESESTQIRESKRVRLDVPGSSRVSNEKEGSRPAGESEEQGSACAIAVTVNPPVIPTRTLPPGVPVHAACPRWYRRFPVPPPIREDKAELRGTLAGATHNAPRDLWDLYTPRFVKGRGASKVGLCPICAEPCARGGEGSKVWLSMKFSAYKCYHMQYAHGISTGGIPFSPPVAFRTVKHFSTSKYEKTQLNQGRCHKCKKWVNIEGVKDVEVKVPEIYWWKHAAACHQGATLDGERDIFIEDNIYSNINMQGRSQM